MDRDAAGISRGVAQEASIAQQVLDRTIGEVETREQHRTPLVRAERRDLPFARTTSDERHRLALTARGT